MYSERLNIFAVLIVSICWGLGGPLIWIASKTVSPESITAWRCLIAFFLLLPFYVKAGLLILKQLDFKAASLLASAGVTLVIHFYLFTVGIKFVSLITVLILVSLEPVLILLAGTIIFKEQVSKLSILGIFICLFGLILMGSLQLLQTINEELLKFELIGNLYAIAAVLAYVVYYILNRAYKNYAQPGRYIKSIILQNLGISSVIYMFSAIVALPLCLSFDKFDNTIIDIPTGNSLIAILALGLFPTLIGHLISQLVSRSAHPIWISLMSPGEVLMGILISYLFLNHIPKYYELVGGFVVILGVFIVIYSECFNRKN